MKKPHISFIGFSDVIDFPYIHATFHGKNNPLPVMTAGICAHASFFLNDQKTFHLEFQRPTLLVGESACDVRRVKGYNDFFIGGIRSQEFELRLHNFLRVLQKEDPLILAFLAYYDELTQLPNTKFLNEKGQEMMHEKTTFVYIDIDSFKTINDTYGHSFGDDMLKAFAARLKKIVRKGDIVARIGGDEFCMVIANLYQPAHIHAFTQRLLEEIRSPFFVQGKKVFLTASLGVSTRSHTSHSLNFLRHIADQAMYVVKRNGKNNFFASLEY